MLLDYRHDGLHDQGCAVQTAIKSRIDAKKVRNPAVLRKPIIPIKTTQNCTLVVIRNIGRNPLLQLSLPKPIRLITNIHHAQSQTSTPKTDPPHS